MKKLRDRINMMALLTALLVIAVITGCEKKTYLPPAVDPNTTWKLSTDIQPIFNNNCITCHNGSRTPDLRAGHSYQSLSTGGFITPPGSSSRLYTQMISASHAARSTDAEKLKVKYWIDQGAKNN